MNPICRLSGVLVLGCLLAPCVLAQDIAEPPYSADEIRDATRPGRRYTFRQESQGNVTYNVMEFVSVSEDSLVMQVTQQDGERKTIGEPATRPDSWAALESHAHFPKDHTTIEDAEVEVPAGSFACSLYTVADPAAGMVQRFWFANELPGAPVKVEVLVQEKVVFTMLLEEHRAGE